MSLHDNRYQRLDAIERRLASRPEGWTTGELARDLGVDPSTISRDLTLLEERGTGLIQHGRRYILDHRRSLYTLKLSNDEVLAIHGRALQHSGGVRSTAAAGIGLGGHLLAQVYSITMRDNRESL